MMFQHQLNSQPLFAFYMAIRWYVSMRAAFIRDLEVGTQRTEGACAFRSTSQTVGNVDDINLDVV